MSAIEPPRCPITMDYMVDPVFDVNGHTFERSAIENWYQTHDTSPVTNLPVANKILTPNFSVKQLMEEYNQPRNGSPQQMIVDPVQQPILPPTVPTLVTNSEIFEHNGTQYVNINLSLDTPIDQVITRKPVRFICVIDISGSMGERATEYVPNGENDGFTRLDLVKHSLNTIVASLNPHDEIALVTFSSVAQILLRSTKISESMLIKSSINSLQPGGNTNLWDGLKSALDIISADVKEDYNTSILVLTDGVANYNPPRGIIPTLNSYPQKGNYTINTFAYGYEVDSVTLAHIAEIGNGIYGYIPDGTMVGTIFINAISNILSTGILNTKIRIESNSKLEFFEKVYNAKLETNIDSIENSCANINIGSILYGQSRNITFKVVPSKSLKSQQFLIQDFICQLIINADGANYEHIIVNNGEISLTTDQKVNIIARANLVATLSQLTDSFDNSKQILNLLSLVKSLSQTMYLKDMANDLSDPDPNKGQLGKSVEKLAWYTKWGKHYLLSVSRAHILEMCFNFKDLAIQHYKGDNFNGNQAIVEQIFNQITPPEPSIKESQQYDHYNHYGYNNANANASAMQPKSMLSSMAAMVSSMASIPQSYYNVSGGCFTGNWLVNMAAGEKKPVNKIRPNDYVVSLDSPTGVAKVIAVVMFRINQNIDMVSPDGTNGVTLYHPMYISDGSLDSIKWIFPCDYTEATYGTTTGEYMYDFVLDAGHTVLFEDKYNFACLGHGITTNNVISHEYFGTKRIIDDLSRHPDWKFGTVILNNWQFTRDSNNRVNGLIY